MRSGACTCHTVSPALRDRAASMKPRAYHTEALEVLPAKQAQPHDLAEQLLHKKCSCFEACLAKRTK